MLVEFKSNMKGFIIAVICMLFPMLTTCGQDMQTVVDRALDRATSQALLLAHATENKEGSLPKNYRGGRLRFCSPTSWVSGFFPGVLWYLYENAREGDDAVGNNAEELLSYAKVFTERLDSVKWVTNNHDVGFMINCSFGNGLRLIGDPYYKEVMIQAARSLATRYNSRVGCIKSWQTVKGKWQYPVIIDNMLNLELMTQATKLSGDKQFEDMAVSHSIVTMKNHFRPDYSSFHVVSYDTITGQPHAKNTHQGYADQSAWARGQAWALYGYTMMYRETGRREFLKQAVRVGKYISKRLPIDYIPYWDFDDPRITGRSMENEKADFYRKHLTVPRDASAAAIYASAYLELSQYVTGKEAKHFRTLAENIIRMLSSQEYLAEPGEQGGFILKHSTGNMAKNSEVDVPLTYADYYYVEALMRLKHLLNGTSRDYWVKQLTTIAAPVIDNLAAGTLKKNMPYENLEPERRPVAYLEAGGRTILGISAWLELGEDKTAEGRLRGQWIKKAQKALANLVDPNSPDYTPFNYQYGMRADGSRVKYNQPLVDAAFLAQGLIRAPKVLWQQLDKKTQENLLTEFRRAHNIKPNESNWLLFASIIEAFLLDKTGTCDTMRLMRGVRRFMDDGWYKGDGCYGDGADFRQDYYNSFVINAMLTDVLDIAVVHGLVGETYVKQQLKRQQRYAMIQERQIMPDGSFPVCGRSMCYRMGCFNQLNQTALQHRLPKHLKPAQVRCALTAMILRIMKGDNFDADGWLYLGFCGHQPALAEKYLNTGSMYMCTTGFGALGLPASDPFWSDPDMPWTSVKAYAGSNIPADHALRDSKWKP